MKSNFGDLEKNDKNLHWIQLVLYVTDMKYIFDSRLSAWAEIFSEITIAAPSERPEHIPQGIGWCQYDREKCCSEIWNHLLSGAEKDWVLFLEENETVRMPSIPEENELAPDLWPPVYVSQKVNDVIRNNYQMRLVYKCDGTLFQGKNLPDCTRYITQNQIRLTGQPVIVERESECFQNIDLLEEMSVPDASPQIYLIQGEQFISEGKYVHASAQYRKLLKTKNLLPFDRLAAVNGLARCFTEQYKWSRAVLLAEQSIEAEPAQKLPYLIQYRIFQLNKEWKKAFDILKKYNDQFNVRTRVSFDKAIEKHRTLQDLADLALKAGLKNEALYYLEELFTGKNGKPEKDILNRILVLSVELENREKSIFYFEHMFQGVFPQAVEGKRATELNDFMSLFMKNGWHTYVSGVYEKLYEMQPENAEFRRRLIVTLSKSNRLHKARTLIARSA